ncbi:MAG TPA: methionine--tRNA ligase [Candidatus Nanoarchaeia archaeon]|nr:methionine--tRNA ligase [Candidatus Nanoarchaeia archaeon]
MDKKIKNITNNVQIAPSRTKSTLRSSPKSNLKSKKISSKKVFNTSNKIVITAALPYANGPIHIGHLLEYVQADIYARFLKLVGKEVLYICASDMHGTPIEVNAQKAGIDPEKFVDKYWKEHQRDFSSFLIEFSNYYKTHSPENRQLAEFFFQTLKSKQLIYRRQIDTIYCKHCRRSLPDRYVKGQCPHCRAQDQYGDVCETCSRTIKGIDLLNPYCSICNNKPIRKKSEHYFFKLSSFSSKIERWINSASQQIQPEIKHWLEGWIKTGLEDWCISRDAPYFGFEIPNSKEETGEVKYFYVWLDAPIGYISSTKNYCDRIRDCCWEDFWKKGEVYHFIGKDIAYFHYLFWWSMLDAVGLPLPKITTHGWITVNGQKMSKSRGTFFTAQDFIKLYPPESLRFYYASHLDRKLVDVDLNLADFTAVNNNVLAANLGNFCYRVLTFAQKNYGSVKKIKSEKILTHSIFTLIGQVKISYQQQNFKSALKTILQIADLSNAYFQQAEPWNNQVSKEGEVGLCVNIARNLAIILSPVLPNFSQKIFSTLGLKKLEQSWDQINFNWKGQVNLPEILVQKIEEAEEVKDSAVKKAVKKKESELKLKVEFPLRMQVGKIIEVNDHPNADSLYLLKVNIGAKNKPEIKQVVAGIKKNFSPDKILGRKAVFAVNLKPAKIRGELSEAMALLADDSPKLAFLEVSKTKIGEEVNFGNLIGSSSEITFEQFSKLELIVKDGKVMFNHLVLKSQVEEVKVVGVKDGSKVR